MKLKKLSLFTDYARKEGFEIGEKRGMEIAYAQVVINAAGGGMSVENISDIAELSAEQVYNILSKRK